MNIALPPEQIPENPESDGARAEPPKDLEACPRCGSFIGVIIWGQTNCPNCGLHFECC